MPGQGVFVPTGPEGPGEGPQGGDEGVHQEAREWHEIFRRNNPQTGGEFVRPAEGYQGVSLALAKALLEQAEKATGPEKGKLKRRPRRILGEMAKIFSSHQKEANELRRSLGGVAGSNAEPGSFDEACEQGDDALSHNKWGEAIGCYNKALHKATKKDASKLSKVKDAIGVAYFLHGPRPVQPRQGDGVPEDPEDADRRLPRDQRCAAARPWRWA